MKIDIFPHIFPRRFFERMLEAPAGGYLQKRMRGVAALWDLDERRRILGGMVPYFEGRVGYGLDQLGSRTDDPDDMGALSRLKRRPLDYFKMFYGDTATFGSYRALECGIGFFGADRVLFGTDMPMDPEKGHGFIRETIAALDRVRVPPEDRTKIYEGNARRLLRLRTS